MKYLINRILGELDRLDFYAGIYFEDISEGTCGATIEINADRVFESASCIKLFILIDFYRQIACGGKKRNDILEYGAENRAAHSGVLSVLEPGSIKMTAKSAAALMMVISDNTATNMLIDYLGIDSINRTIRDIGFRRTKLLNKIVWEKYSRIGTTTPKEYGLAFKKLAGGELFDADITTEITDILKKVWHNDMLVRNLSLSDLDRMGRKGSVLKHIMSKDGELRKGLSGPEKNLENIQNAGGIVSTIYGDYVISIFTGGFRDRYFHSEHPAIMFGAKVSGWILDAFIVRKRP